MATRKIRIGSYLGVICVGMLIATSAVSGETKYEYDPLGRLVKVTYSDGSTVAYSYDQAGNRVAVTTMASAPSGNKWGEMTWGTATW